MSTQQSGPPTRYRLFWRVAICWVLLDQLTKGLVWAALAPGTYAVGGPEGQGAVAVIPGFFYFVHVHNYGAAWSLFDGASRLLGVLGLAALVGVYCWRRQLELSLRFHQVIFGAICGGIFGNVIDRLMHGYVVDFLDFHFGTYRYPAFNIADCGITVGVTLYILLSFFRGSPRPEPSGEDKG